MTGSRRTVRNIATAVLTLLLPACDGAPSALEPRGPGAARIESLWWLIFWISAAVFLVVLGFLLVAAGRGLRTAVRVDREVRWGDRFVVVSGVVVPAIILIAVFVVSLQDMAALSRTGRSTTLTIDVVSHDWWWEARYPDQTVTANEIHIPVGEPVRLRLLTDDVIHSFWVPQLQGKTDHVTGRTNQMWLEADEPGRYRGQCAEFCGLQHANMAFFIVAEPMDEFQTWLTDNARSAAVGASSEDAGLDVFMTTTCAGCHAIRGTPADAQVGPDLTHLAQRETLLAGTIANTRANLATVITSPQSLKPGVGMPPTELSGDELDALVDYLERLE
ncbi:MAG: cytochrome c oxidase subunit II [Actinomycetota bacterium]